MAAGDTMSAGRRPVLRRSPLSPSGAVRIPAGARGVGANQASHHQPTARSIMEWLAPPHPFHLTAGRRPIPVMERTSESQRPS